MKRVSLSLLLFLINPAVADAPAWKSSSIWNAGTNRFTAKGTREFQSEGPMLRSVRISRRVLPAGLTCEKVFARLKTRSIGEAYDSAKTERFSGWDRWQDDLDAVQDCDSFPCKIKFSEPETLSVAAKPKEGRLAETQRLVDLRIQEYAKSSKRRGYDLPEDPVDPWKEFAAVGHVIPPALEKTPAAFYTRRLKFGEGSYRPLRQVFDERTFTEKGRFLRISRDVYTAHYFDGWGEWLEVRCAKDGKSLNILQDLLMEFDLLKNTDFFSRIARPKMRQGVDHESLKYQRDQAERLFAP